MKYKEYKQLDLTAIGTEIRKYWEDTDAFGKGQKLAEGRPSYVFYDGPPSANGKPGIHHVMARTIKDLFCRYKASKGYQVERKAGWDTHGLPVELGVEKALGITKEDIGKKISVDDYNRACRTEVLKYKDLWDELTRQMGYWIDLEHPYITFDNNYIETLWHLLKKLYDKGLLYKGYTIQPFSPAAGTGLSSHELNLPGCYRDVKDTTCVAMFKLCAPADVFGRFGLQAGASPTFSFSKSSGSLLTLPQPENDSRSEMVYAVAWTTTPWTLPSNTALCVGPNIDYVLLQTTHPQTGDECYVVMAEARVGDFYTEGEPPEKSRLQHCTIVGRCKGAGLEGLYYDQLIPWVKPTVVNSAEGTHRTAHADEAFRVITGDYVTTDDGTGIVHIAPTFGADDARVAKKAGIADLLLYDQSGKQAPMVDRTGKFWNIADLDAAWVKENVDVQLYSQYAGKFVKNAYDPAKSDKDISLDVELVVMLKEQGKLLRSEKHTHSYPHCWRTDKPVLYYPLDSWFIRTTAYKERMAELNRTINWKPEATGSGRFGNWLENIVDWNLSRSRYWGTPLPIWRTEDGKEELCIGSVAELRGEIEKSVKAGFMSSNPYAADTFDLHRPYIDDVVLCSPSGKPMRREPDLIDVWFDSGAMPYAQIHYMGGDLKESQFPADFIAEGVDQTRGWFYTLHAIATMCFDSVAFKNVVSNGLVLDKNGNKMSKRLGNAVDPFETIAKYGPDATRWYMITNSQPWDNLKFDLDGVDEVRRKLFGTLYNTYSFFALYANIDGFDYSAPDVPHAQRPEIDRWILSELNTLTATVDAALSDYEPTRAGRAVQEFVDAYLSNWYVRLCRRRFWKGDMSDDKLSAYQTLYTCLETLSRLMAPIAPFFSERLFLDLNEATHRHNVQSVHHLSFPVVNPQLVDKALEQRMQLAQQICSMGLSLRKRSNIRVRQPLAKIMLPVTGDEMRQQIQKVQHLICSELNVKEVELIGSDNNLLVKNIKPNFKTLGPRYGKIMKAIAVSVAALTQEQISSLEAGNDCQLTVEGQSVTLTPDDVTIATQDIAGWVVANEGTVTVALDINITPELRDEGMAREIVNRIQNIRKESFDVTDRIKVTLQGGVWNHAVEVYKDYICTEILCTDFTLADTIDAPEAQEVEILDGQNAKVLVCRS
ncbi:MAG: isoleucine--tRNA ligase [Bacteroidales bacterium]|nr:isoleucine--tRNA ligase [Bacteroidales bacterium]